MSIVKTSNEIAQESLGDSADISTQSRACPPGEPFTAEIDGPWYDLRAALSNNTLGEKIEQIATVILELTDGQDEASWSWIVKLKNDKFAYVSGGHDYTGWDCQSSCDWIDADTFAEAMQLASQDDRRIFEDMIAAGRNFMNTSIPEDY